MDVSIRKAARTDLPAVYGLVCQLAEYEKEPQAVTVGVEQYEEAYGQNLIDVIVAELGGEIVGIALFYLTFSTWKGKCLYLEDFYVKPTLRQYGIGRKLFDAYLNEARRLGARQAKWQVLDWNQPALNFYEKYDATIEKNWWNGKIFLHDSQDK